MTYGEAWTHFYCAYRNRSSGNTHERAVEQADLALIDYKKRFWDNGNPRAIPEKP